MSHKRFYDFLLGYQVRLKNVTFYSSGIGKFQIGDQIKEVNANEDPTLIIIPGNTPHQILNEHDEPLMFFYYFPGDAQNAIKVQITSR